VSKTSLALTSLVAAVPGLALLVLLILSFFSDPGFENMAGLLKYFAIAALLASAAVVLMPAGILVFAGRAGRETADESGEAAAEAKAADESDSAVESDAELAGHEEIAEDGFGEEEFGEEEEPASSSAEDVFEAGEDEEFEDFDIEGFDDERKR
jgi:hypothetical protein